MRVFTTLAAVCAAGAILLAQAPTPQTGAPAQPTFRTGVTLVTTDVIPRDNDGRFISDLTKDEFQITEDGEPQTVQSFVLVHGGRICPSNFATDPAGAYLYWADQGIIYRLRVAP